MKLRVTVGLILVLTMLLSGCGEGKFEPDTMSMDDIAILKIDDKKSKVYYGMKRSEAEKILGTGNQDGSFIKYDFGVEIVYRVNEENNEETVGYIKLEEESKKVYSTIRGAKVGNSTSDVTKLYGEKYPIQMDARINTIRYYYDLKTTRFMGKESISKLELEDTPYVIIIDFKSNREDFVENIRLSDRRMQLLGY